MTTVILRSQSRRDEAYQTLAGIDWTFRDAYTRGGTHGIHPYPAKFIPQIPRALIAALHPKDGSAVLDPFCGSGTTLVEAGIAGVPAVGIDLHPLACLITSVKVTSVSTDLGEAAEEVLARAATSPAKPPPIPALDHWFRKEIQQSLATLIRSIDLVKDNDIRNALRVAVSSIIVRVSNQESDTRYAAISKSVTAEDVSQGFRNAVRSIAQSLHETWGSLFIKPQLSVINRNILEVTPAEIGVPISLTITSPPYPNAYEYWLYHKYRMYWLGMDPLAVRQAEIGARPHYFKRRPQTAADFEAQLDQVFRLLSMVTTRGGHACFQVGSSVIRRELVDNVQLVRKTAARHGFVEVLRLAREIPLRRKAFNPSHGRIKTEDLLVLRLDRR